MTSVLMVAEKPMLAEAIAKLLSNDRSQKRKGWNNVCSVNEYSGDFMGRPAKFKVTSTCGHIMGLDFPPKFNNWERVDPVQLFEAPTEKKETNPAMKMNDFLASEARGCEYLVLWLDCDKEGENICFEVIEATVRNLKVPKSGNIMDNVYRAHFSAITEKDIKGAMRALIRPNRNESLAVDARQELDLRIGCAFTRFQTRYFQGKYGDLDNTCVSFGPCQTPTLGFCVTRHDIINQFRPEPYWVIQTIFETNDGKELKPEYSRGSIFDRDVCQLLLERIKKAKNALVLDVSSKESRKEKPCALNTVEMLRVASSGLGMSPSTAMSTAEFLYTRGFISYPRTETNTYPSSFDLITPLRLQQNDAVWGSVVKEVLAQGITKARSGEDKGDHPPITPMRANDGSLSGDALRLYEYVTRHFIATLMRACKFLITTIRIGIGDEQFTLSGREVVDPGYTSVLPWQSVNENSESIPDVKRGDRLTLKEAKIVERQTSPPDYLTESELITMMEKHGIGTDASIPVHINTICQRNYVTVASGRRLIPTKLGIALVHGYWKVDPELVLPTMRSEVEAQLNLIAKGQADFFEVKEHALDMFRLKFIYFVENILAVDSLFEDSFSTLAESGKPFSRCGKCRRFMKLIASKPQRLHCTNCQDTYSLPSGKDGVLKLHSEKKCPLDDFDLVYWQGSGGKLSNSYALCPYCFNNPPFEGMIKSVGCNQCVHPSCPNSLMTQGLVQCPRKCASGHGVLVLDPQSAPKWRFACNRCSSVLIAFEGAQKLKVLERQCEACLAQWVQVDYKDDKCPLPDGESQFKGCIFCDESVQSLINMNHLFYERADSNMIGQQQGGGRRGGSRGGGRGRGRGGNARRGTPRGGSR